MAKLVEPAQGPCVSIYLPFRGKGEPWEERKARLASLVNRTERLLARHFPEAKDQLLSPFLKLGERVSDLLGSERGVAFFKSKDVEGFALLQDPAEEAAIVAESFHVKPLLSEIQRQRAFYVVSLKAKSVRLYEGSDLGLGEVQTFEKRESNIHSLLDRTPRRQKSTLDFLREAEKQIRDSIAYDSSPLVLVGPPELQVAFRSVNRFRNAIAAGVDLVAEEHPEPNALFRTTWPIINGLKKRREARTLAEYRELQPAGRTTDSLAKIAQAAAHGQVKTLILEEGCTIQGKLDTKTGRVEIHQHPDDHPIDDVFDDLAELVLNHGGAVSVIAARDMPSASPAVAILRPRRLGLFRPMSRGGSA